MSRMVSIGLALAASAMLAVRVLAQDTSVCPDPGFAQKIEALRQTAQRALSAREPDTGEIERQIIALWPAIPDHGACRMLVVELAVALGSPLRMALLEKVLAADPSARRARIILAYDLLRQREALRAMLERLAGDNPGDMDVQYLEALLAFEHKDFWRVDKLLARSGPSDYLPEELFLRAQAQVHLKNPNAARFMFQQMLTLDTLGSRRNTVLPAVPRGEVLWRQVEACEWLAADGKKRRDAVHFAAYGFLARYLPHSAGTMRDKGSNMGEKELLDALRRLHKNRNHLQAAREIVLMHGADRQNSKIRQMLGHAEQQAILARDRLQNCAGMEEPCRWLFPELVPATESP